MSISVRCRTPLVATPGLQVRVSKSTIDVAAASTSEERSVESDGDVAVVDSKCYPQT
jgi:hypothetical protein